MIEQLDFFVRIITIGASLMLLAQVVEGEIRAALKVPLVGLLVGVVAYAINSTPMLEPTGWADDVVNLLSMATPVWAWLFARRLFDRDPAMKAVQAAAAALLVVWLAGIIVEELGLLTYYGNRLISLVLIADLIRIALRDRADDLIEKRRLIRLVLPTLIGLQIGLILIFDLLRGPFQPISWLQFATAVLILVITLFSGLALMRADRELLLESEQDPVDQGPETPELSPSERVLHEKLTAAMDEGVYRTPGLTIATLAEHLETPEHRLRALINRGLGYRNFSAFLNRRRIAEAREKLSSRDDVDVPILTIAMDLGYNSLPTFNRAFKAETGTTPSEYRRTAADQY